MDNITITIRYTYSPPHRGYRNSLYVPETPDDPEEIFIHDIVDEYGSSLELNDMAVELIEEHILRHIKSWTRDL